MRVEIDPNTTATEIRDYVLNHSDLIYDEYESPPNSLNGGCYILAESYFHARGGTDSPLDIYCLSWSDVDASLDGTHWYLRNTETGTWVDLGLDTPNQAEDVPFGSGTRRAFITGYEPSKRAQRVLNALDIAY